MPMYLSFLISQKIVVFFKNSLSCKELWCFQKHHLWSLIYYFFFWAAKSRCFIWKMQPCFRSLTSQTHQSIHSLPSCPRQFLKTDTNISAWRSTLSESSEFTALGVMSWETTYILVHFMIFLSCKSFLKRTQDSRIQDCWFIFIHPVRVNFKTWLLSMGILDCNSFTGILILTAAWANCLQPLFIHSLQGSTFIYWYNKLCQHARSIISSAETLEYRSWPQRQSATYSKHITGMKGLTGEIYCFIYHSYISLTGKLSAVPAGYYAL